MGKLEKLSHVDAQNASAGPALSWFVIPIRIVFSVLKRFRLLKTIQ